MSYKGDWMECFQFEKYVGNEHLSCKGKILFKTPCIDYFLDKEQFQKLKKKIMDVEL